MGYVVLMAGAIPYNPVTDNFNRANENPLSGGGNWANFSAVGASGVIALTSNAIAATNTIGGAAYWTPGTVVGGATNWEMGISCIQSQLNDAAFGFNLYGGVTNPTNTPTVGFYRYSISLSSGSVATSIVTHSISRVDNNTVTWSIGLSTSGTFYAYMIAPNGCDVVFRRIGTILEVWARGSADAYITPANQWGRICAVNEFTTFGQTNPLSGTVGFFCQSQGPGGVGAYRWDNFIVGLYPATTAQTIGFADPVVGGMQDENELVTTYNNPFTGLLPLQALYDPVAELVHQQPSSYVTLQGPVAGGGISIG